MRFRSFPLAVLLALLLALGACGSKDDVSHTGTGGAQLATAPVAENLGLLVPADTDVLFYAPNLDALANEVSTAIGIFDPDMAAEVNLDKMRGELPIGDLMDAGKPIAVALRISADGEPVATLIASVTDVAKAQERARGATLPVMPTSGSYVAMLLGKEAAAAAGTSAPAIAKNIPVGDVVIRANLAALRATFAEQIDEGFAEAKKGIDRGLPKDSPLDMSGFMDSMMKGVKTFIDSAEGLDIVLDLEDGNVNVKGLLSVKAGSEMDGLAKGITDVSGLADRLPSGFPIAVLFSGKIGEWPEWVDDLIEQAMKQLPEEFAGLPDLMRENMEKLGKILGSRHGMAMRIDEGGVAVVALHEVNDADAYFKMNEDSLSDPRAQKMLDAFGMEMDMLPPTTVAGTEVRHMRMAIDFEKMMALAAPGKEMPEDAKKMMQEMMTTVFGPDGMVVNLAAVDGYVLSVVGGGEALMEQAIKAAQGTDTMKADLASAMEAAGGSPSFLVYLDGRALAKGALGFAKTVLPPEQSDEIPTCPDGNPVPLVFYGSADGRFYMGGFNVDLQSIQDLIADFSKK